MASETLQSLRRAAPKFMPELAGVEPIEDQPFSLREALIQASTPDGLRRGHERAVCGAMATLMGESFDGNRLRIPLQALAGRDLTAGTAAAGGFLKGTGTSSPIDVLRPWSVAIDGGITVLPDLTGDMVVPRTTTNTVAGAVANESTGFVAATPVVGQATLQPKTLGTWVKFSRLWRLQSGAAGELYLRQQLLGAVGALVDLLFFSGSGASGQPLGLVSTPGIGTQSGTSLAHAGLLAMRRQVLTAGGREAQLSWVGTPVVQETLASRERSTGGGRFLWDDGLIMGRPAAATINTATGSLVCGDFSQAVMGIFGPAALLVEINPFDTFPAGILAARVALSFDIAFPNPGAFSVAATVT
jgi:HK97 family phage major capsid protein